MMITVTKIILAISFSFLTDAVPEKKWGQNHLSDIPHYGITSDSTRRKAYTILVKKCNVCHTKRNRSRVFTQENMHSWAADIYTQVFLKKRMPKGRKVKLIHEEYQELLIWISTSKNQNNGI